ncbi:MAG TPA: SulP family inorganic anion transporter [Polyangiaceae bacterium]
MTEGNGFGGAQAADNQPRTSASERVPQQAWLRFVYRRVPAIESLRHYSFVALRADFLAGLTVASVAVPQAMAYAIAAGVPAAHGLYTAIVMTAVGALFASSKQLINGPTNVVSIAVLSALAPVPPEHKLACAITLSLLVGGFQMLITLFKLGDLTRYVSHSVIIGFTTGASLLLVLDQTRNLFGWRGLGSPHDHFLQRTWHTWVNGDTHVESAAMGFSAMAAVIVLRVIKKRLKWPLLPDLLLVVIASGYAAYAFGLEARGVKVIGDIPASLPNFQPPVLMHEYLGTLSESAIAIATLGLLEALAMAKHIAARTGQKLDLNQLCLSEGLANLSSAFFRGIPGSGSLTRSAINQQAGAHSQWSGVWSAAAVALITLLFAPFAQYIPRPALAGILIVTAFGMIDWKGLPFHLKATRFDAFIVAATALAAIGISVEFCILIGVLLSFVLAVPRAGRMTRTEFVITSEGIVRERREKDPVNDRLLIVGLEGELFFGSSLALDEHLDWCESRVDAGAEVIVLRVKRLRNPDAVGMHELQRFLQQMRARGVRVVLAGVRSDLLQGLETTGVMSDLDANQVFSERSEEGSSTLAAIAEARALLARKAAPETRPLESLPAPVMFEV